MQKANDLQKKVVELTQKWEKGRQDMGAKERGEAQAILSKMEPIIASLAQREGMTMVFEKSDSGLVFAPPHLDLTNEVVRLYNDQHKGKAEPKAAAEPAKGGPPPQNPPKADAPKQQPPSKADVPKPPMNDVPKREEAKK
jgi:outer membrane protein